MSVAHHLENYPTLNQNKEDTNHLYPDVNAGMDCVPTCIATALIWYTDTQYYGDEIIDAVYGTRYLGGTAAQQYIDYCAARGIHLWHIDGNNVQLVDAIIRELESNIPCLLTIPGHWNDPNATGQNPGNVTHVVVATGYDDQQQLIEVMNPWNGNFEEYSYSWFHVKLCFNQIWVMEGTRRNSVQSNGAGKVLIQHPTIVGRVDLLYVGTDDQHRVWHNWNDEKGLATLASPHGESWGKPANRDVIPYSVSGCWNGDGTVLQCSVACYPDGQIYIKSLNYHGDTVLDWTQVTGQTMQQ